MASQALVEASAPPAALDEISDGIKALDILNETIINSLSGAVECTLTAALAPLPAAGTVSTVADTAAAAAAVAEGLTPEQSAALSECVDRFVELYEQVSALMRSCTGRHTVRLLQHPELPSTPPCTLCAHHLDSVAPTACLRRSCRGQ